MASVIKSLTRHARGLLIRPGLLSARFSSSGTAAVTTTSHTNNATPSSSMSDFKASNTDLLTFLVRRDVATRKKVIKIPFFTSGSYLAVTYADCSPAGINRFVGICIAIRRKGLGTNIILRNVMNGVAIEKFFELYSPSIRDVQVLRLERRRRAKLYYLRDKPLKFSTVKEDMKPEPHDGTVKLYRRKPGDPA